jgi:hypothetical protein
MGGNERERKLALSHEKLGGRQVEQGDLTGALKS